MNEEFVYNWSTKNLAPADSTGKDPEKGLNQESNQHVDIKPESLIICCVLNPTIILHTVLLEERSLSCISSFGKTAYWSDCGSSRCEHTTAIQIGSETHGVIIIVIILLMKTSQDATNN